MDWVEYCNLEALMSRYVFSQRDDVGGWWLCEQVLLMNEILTCIKLIKLYAWEKPFATKIAGQLNHL